MNGSPFFDAGPQQISLESNTERIQLPLDVYHTGLAGATTFPQSSKNVVFRVISEMTKSENLPHALRDMGRVLWGVHEASPLSHTNGPRVYGAACGRNSGTRG